MPHDSLRVLTLRMLNFTLTGDKLPSAKHNTFQIAVQLQNHQALNSKHCQYQTFIRAKWTKWTIRNFFVVQL